MRAFMFIIESEDSPIGEAWLQQMNLPEVLRECHRTASLWRIDLSLGEQNCWGKGIGTEVIGALARFGFGRQKADALFGCHVSKSNLRSVRAFERNGFSCWRVADREGSEGPDEHRLHLVLTRTDWKAAQASA